MLTPEALGSWVHEDADETRGRIQYVGVFIPTDISWGRQLESLSRAGLNEEHARPIVASAFSTAVLRAVVAAVLARVNGDPSIEGAGAYRPLGLSPAAEASLATDVSATWGVDIRLPTLAGLMAALSTRLVQLHVLASRERLLSGDGRSERLAGEPVLHLDLVTACTALLDALEAQVPETRGQRWALLFDELELAPSVVREELLASMRSVDDRFLFKLSISPYSEDLDVLESALSAMPGHDYEEVLLTYGNRDDSIAFSTGLFSAILRSRDWQETSPPTVLGRSEFEAAPEEWQVDGHAYASGGRLGKRYRTLARNDATFADYLVRNNIDVEQLELVPPLQRAQVLRKVNAFVAVRSTFRADDEVTAKTGRRLRSRKAPQLYRGATSLFSMLEGNPRWVIGVANQLLEGVEPGEDVPVSRQSREIARTAARFRSLLTTIPVADSIGAGRRGLLPLLDAIGDYFTQRVVLDAFNPDAPGSFVVDSDAPPELEEALGRALNAGAIIYVPDADSANVLSSLRGKRFRLCYLFSPHYLLPIRLGRQVSLGRILRAESVAPSTDQLELDA
jgi:hypothetical protein